MRRGRGAHLRANRAPDALDSGVPTGVGLHALFFLSGAAALAYEVLWMRRFGVLLGAAAPAAASALAAFFAGLGLGSWALGRLAPRLPRPLLAFAVLEIGTGLSALGVDPLLAALQPAYARLYDLSGVNPVPLLAAKMALAVVVVLVPAFCMGGTLPLLAQHVAANARRLGVHAGGLYAVNTLGAAGGALIVPLLLLPRFGATGALACAVAVNLAVGMGALVLDRQASRAAPGAPSGAMRAGPATTTRHRLGPLAFALASGALTVGLESLATRFFALVHENSVYSFAIVVATFLAGLGAGAALARAALRRGRSPRAVVVAGWAGAGAWCVLLPAFFVELTGLDYVGGGSLLGHEMRLAGLAAATLLVPSVLAGLALPAVMEESGGSATAGGPAVGGLIAANTVGAIVGPFLALFALVPAVGLWGATSAIGFASLACALAAAPGAGHGVRRALAVAVVVALASWLAVPPSSLPRTKLSASDRLLDLREGAMGTVAVVERDGQRRIKLNNYYVLGGTTAVGDERLQGHIPLLLHPRPERVAYLGLGTAISLSAVRFHPVREAVALELVPEVVGAARDWFGAANLSVLEDPRVRVRAEDARGFLAATRERFDVVIGDLVVPWRRGEASLHTRESFQAARRALAPGGVFCQWIPLYQLSESEFDGIVASFLDVFPQATLWRGDFSADQPALALVGHTDPRGLDAAAADARVRALAASPDGSNPYLVHPAGLWLYFVGPLDPSEPRFQAAPRNRDSSPWVELASPELHLLIEHGEARGLVGRALIHRLEAVRSASRPGRPALLSAEQFEWRERGAEIGEAAVLSFEGDNAAADRKGLEALSRLPVEIQISVLGAPLPR